LKTNKILIGLKMHLNKKYLLGIKCRLQPTFLGHNATMEGDLGELCGKSDYLQNQNAMQIGRCSVCANAPDSNSACVICLDLIVDCFDTQEQRHSTRICLTRAQHSAHSGTRIYRAKFASHVVNGKNNVR
jgi:hypothetical protein